jgi:hypothetical protein
MRNRQESWWVFLGRRCSSSAFIAQWAPTKGAAVGSWGAAVCDRTPAVRLGPQLPPGAGRRYRSSSRSAIEAEEVQAVLAGLADDYEAGGTA